MLAGDKYCSLATQQFVQDNKKYMEMFFFDQNNCQMILPTSIYFNYGANYGFKKSGEVKNTFAFEAANALGVPMNDENKYILAHYGIALYGTFFAYNPSEEDASKKIALYTTSMSVLRSMASRGTLTDKKKSVDEVLENIDKKLFNGIIKKNIKDLDSLYAVRLDPVFNGKYVKFTATIPRTSVKLSTHMIIPYDCMKSVFELFDQILRNDMLRVTCGDKVRIVSKNVNVLNSVYNADGRSPEYVDKVLSENYDARTLRFYCPVIGASRYSAGTTSLHITEIDKIERVGIPEVDFSDVNVNLLGVRFEAVNQLKANPSNCGAVASYMKTKFDVDSADEEELYNNIKKMYDLDAWEMMKYFDGSIFSCAVYRAKPNRYGHLYEQQSLPISVQNLKELLKTGVYKILIRTQTGKNSTIVCTNNTKVIKEVLGEDYEATYESDGVRYRLAIKAVKAGKPVDMVCKIYHTPCVVSDDPTDYIAMLEEELNAVKDRATVVEQGHLVTVRSLEALDSKSFYKNIDVNNIKELIKLR